MEVGLLERGDGRTELEVGLFPKMEVGLFPKKEVGLFPKNADKSLFCPKSKGG